MVKIKGDNTSKYVLGKYKMRTLVRGFTLLELLLVILIISVIATISTPLFRRSVSTIQLSNTTQDIAQLMRFLKTRASIEKEIYQLKFDFINRQYMSYRVSGNKFEKIGKTKRIPEDINIVTNVNPVTFYTNGAIDKTTMYIFKGENEYSDDLNKVLGKDFTLGQIQEIVNTEYIYKIKTSSSLGKISVELPEK